ncbi:hypothetical protein K413DRAFT_0815 [Clostridium sp. ASBs410]|nr:hypothetical protein K413DRAFT_0815 [Clostridium sp. ASBs410]
MSLLLRKQINNLTEVFDPVKDFYSMRYKRKGEVAIFLLFPISLGLLFLIMDSKLSTCRIFSLDEFTQDLLNQIITMLTLFISFSMAYLSILITSSSTNVENLKNTISVSYEFNRKKNDCSLYHVLICEITYTLIIEIFFLVYVFFQKFIILLSTDIIIKYMIAINISCFVHVLIIMLITVKDIYYSFWKPS